MYRECKRHQDALFDPLAASVGHSVQRADL